MVASGETPAGKDHLSPDRQMGTAESPSLPMPRLATHRQICRAVRGLVMEGRPWLLTCRSSRDSCSARKTGRVVEGILVAAAWACDTGTGRIHATDKSRRGARLTRQHPGTHLLEAGGLLYHAAGQRVVRQGLPCTEPFRHLPLQAAGLRAGEKVGQGPLLLAGEYRSWCVITRHSAKLRQFPTSKAGQRGNARDSASVRPEAAPTRRSMAL